jgi:hypothetical protein
MTVLFRKVERLMAHGLYSLKGYTVDDLKEILDEGKQQLAAAKASGNAISVKRLNATINDILAEQALR